MQGGEGGGALEEGGGGLGVGGYEGSFGAGW